MKSASSGFHSTPLRFRSGLPLAACLAILACGKKEAPSPPDLAPPQEIEAQAEVKASSGPIQLTLRIYKTKIKAGDSFWYQIELKNVGKNKFRVFDEAFILPGGLHPFATVGVFLEVLGPDGKPLKPYTVRRYQHGPFPFEDDSLSPEEQKRLTKLMLADGNKTRRRYELEQALERKGASSAERNQKLDEFDEQNAHIGAPPATPRDLSFWLEPGGAAATLPWAHGSDPKVKPIGQFAELEHFISATSDPGKYRIRAIYDNEPSGWTIDYNRKHNISEDEDRVMVKTPLIQLEVTP